ncbi:MAG: hypothetical protein NDJ89_13615 [Oligoflexia bacterium]|nr:hypothetical protein [Oligoflexia bacterium]
MRYLASVSPKFDRVAIKPGPSLGELPELPIKSRLTVLIRDARGAILGQIDIESHASDAFGYEEEAIVHQVARELGQLWSE